MPEWSNEVPDDPRGVALPIRRTPPHGSLLAVVTSIDLVGTRTHFWQRRTMPHEKIKCEACKAGLPTRWHSYLSAWDHHTKMHFLFELTAQAAQHFVTFRKAHGTLRGCLFKASRWRQIPNGRVLIECKPFDIVSHPIPEAPDLITVLSILWNLPPDQLNNNSPNQVVDLPTDSRDPEENCTRLSFDAGKPTRAARPDALGRGKNGNDVA